MSYCYTMTYSCQGEVPQDLGAAVSGDPLKKQFGLKHASGHFRSGLSKIRRRARRNPIVFSSSRQAPSRVISKIARPPASGGHRRLRSLPPWGSDLGQTPTRRRECRRGSLELAHSSAEIAGETTVACNRPLASEGIIDFVFVRMDGDELRYRLPSLAVVSQIPMRTISLR
jgi:hypothetical protein